MMETKRAESLYESITPSEAKGVEGFKPEDFRPCKGTVLIIVAPVIDITAGGVVLPDVAQETPNYGRVAAVPLIPIEAGMLSGTPDFDPLCPVKPGEWIVFSPSSGNEIPFAGRKDLRLISYTDDLTSEILGVFDGPPEDPKDRIGRSD